MRNIAADDVKKLQTEMLISFDKFCKENYLCYMLCGGTLLGAVRHKGFIPWDDDIDVMMPRPDYEKFLEIVKNGQKIDDHIDVLEYRLHNSVYPFIKLSDQRTIVIERYTDAKTGIWIDIFPIDGNYENRILNFVHYKAARILRKLVEMQYYDIGVESKKSTKLIRTLIFPVIKIIPHKILCDMLNNVSQIKDFASSKFVGRVLMGYGIEQRTERKKIIRPVKVEFEGYQFNAPSNYEELLTQIFGDYMTLPPAEQRKRHDFLVYWKNKDR